MTDTDALLPAEPARELTDEMIAGAQADYDGHTYTHGMVSAVGGARLEQVLRTVEAVLSAGLGRPVALMALHGGLYRLERDQLGEYSDTVVRESICYALEPACERAGVEAFTDDEVSEVSVLLSQQQLNGIRHGYLHRLTNS